jgi:hypothetical protein
MNGSSIERRTAISPGGGSRRTLAVAIAFVATIIGSVGSTRGQTQVIPLRSGSGLTSGSDANVHVLIDGSPVDQAAARTAPLAVVYEPQYGAPNLPTDPTARWVGPAPGNQGGRRTILYAVPFTVNAGPIASADLQWVAKGNGLADDGLVAELLVNGRPIGEIPLEASDLGGAWFTVDDVARLLTAGVNWLQISVPSTDLGSGLIFSARVRIWGPTDLPEPAGRALNDEAGSVVAEFALAEAVGGCIGFTCRPRGDLDSDRDVDLADYVRFLECLNGTQIAPADDCEYADFDCDGDVDLADVGFFQTAFSGSG